MFDNLGVVRHVGQLLDGRASSVPFELRNDGEPAFTYWTGWFVVVVLVR